MEDVQVLREVIHALMYEGMHFLLEVVHAIIDIHNLEEGPVFGSKDNTIILVIEWNNKVKSTTIDKIKILLSLLVILECHRKSCGQFLSNCFKCTCVHEARYQMFLSTPEINKGWIVFATLMFLEKGFFVYSNFFHKIDNCTGYP